MYLLVAVAHVVLVRSWFLLYIVVAILNTTFLTVTTVCLGNAPYYIHLPSHLKLTISRGGTKKYEGRVSPSREQKESCRLVKVLAIKFHHFFKG